APSRRGGRGSSRTVDGGDLYSDRFHGRGSVTTPRQSARGKPPVHPRDDGIGSTGGAFTLTAVVLQLEPVVVGVSDEHHLGFAGRGVAHRLRLCHMGDDVAGVV